MLFPERFNFNNNLFDDFFTDPVFNMTTTNRMSTDIKEKDNGYELGYSHSSSCYRIILIL